MKSSNFAILFVSFAIVGFSILLFSNLTIAQKPGSCQVNGVSYCSEVDDEASSGQSPDGCYCDSLSVLPNYNDYCEDIDTVCGIAKPVKNSVQSYPYPYPYPTKQYPPSSVISNLPEECENFGSPSDNYCDDSPENCASGYVEESSVPECKECSTGKWKNCKSSGSVAPPSDTSSCSSRTTCSECVKGNKVYDDDAVVNCGWDKDVKKCKSGSASSSYDGVYGADKWAWMGSLCVEGNVPKSSQKTQISTNKLFYEQGEKVVVSGKIVAGTFTISIYNPVGTIGAISQGTTSANGTYQLEVGTVGKPEITKLGMLGRYTVKVQPVSDLNNYNITFDVVPVGKSSSFKKIYTGVKSLITRLNLDETIKVAAADDGTEYLVTLLVTNFGPTIRVESTSSAQNIDGLPQDRYLEQTPASNYGTIVLDGNDNIDPVKTKALLIFVPVHKTDGLWAEAVITPV